jgi:cell division protein FtsB
MKPNKKKSNREPFSGLFSILISFMFIGLSVVLIANSAKSIVGAYHRILLLDQAKQEVGELRVRNLELLQRKEEILSEEYVEKEARDRLYYVKDGEIMVVLPETSGAAEIDDSAEGEVKGVSRLEHERDTSWQEWIRIIIEGI